MSMHIDQDIMEKLELAIGHKLYVSYTDTDGTIVVQHSVECDGGNCTTTEDEVMELISSIYDEIAC